MSWTTLPLEEWKRAFEYASHILPDSKSFMDFAIALADYMGEHIIRYCKTIYEVNRMCPENGNIAFEEHKNVCSISTEDILYNFHHFKKQQEEKQREQEFKENIDELQFLVRSFRQKDEFKKLLEFVGRHDYLAPYNAMLVQMQKPGATFVYGGKAWRKCGRRPKVNAQSIIILKPFGPIQCVFDIGDTEIIPGLEHLARRSEMMEEWDSSFSKIEGEVSTKVYDNLCENLPRYGIYLDESFLAANSYGGYIMQYEDKNLNIGLINFNPAYYRSRFVISVNRNQKITERFHTICHELGHLFCRHQYYTSSKRRNLTKKEREFEAETVAWLVCKRLGIKNPSEEYLATYAPNGEIPICSTEYIMKAVAEIEAMLHDRINLTESLWYKEDKCFQAYIKTLKSR